MKTKHYLIATLFVCMVLPSWAQKEYKIPKTKGKLILNDIGNVTINGYDGKEIIFSIKSSAKEEKTDPRATGLSALGSSGFDNTGLGINVTDKNDIIQVAIIDKNKDLQIKVPFGVHVSVNQNKYGFGNETETVTLNNLSSEVEANLKFGNVKFSNIKGPMTLKTINGSIEGKLAQGIIGPISISSNDGFIDLSLPETTKANIAISVTEGSIYADKNLNFITRNEDNITESGKIEVTMKNNDVKVITVEGRPLISSLSGKVTKVKGEKIELEGKNVSGLTISKEGRALDSIDAKEIKAINVVKGYSMNRGSSYNGTLNGGGETIILKSFFGKIYLRKL